MSLLSSNAEKSKLTLYYTYIHTISVSIPPRKKKKRKKRLITMCVGVCYSIERLIFTTAPQIPPILC
ncbi:hypothetical protein L2E82_41959 [Cichorium intybus]|uniref:Uncharacterized protein n=1 Tax=Cichorium intybus TaxID=13427 RepID=A0ACB8ZKB5_CICIN|nr:hypothetical protein L2E82_41959 [Cichorium intybus]